MVKLQPYKLAIGARLAHDLGSIPSIPTKHNSVSLRYVAEQVAKDMEPFYKVFGYPNTKI